VGIAPTGFDEEAEERRVSLEPPTAPKLGPANMDTQTKEKHGIEQQTIGMSGPHLQYVYIS
jgi:hypothetical protein